MPKFLKDRRCISTKWLCLCLLLLAGLARALDPTKKISQYIHDSWDAQHGLPQNSVQTILQTKDGYIWLGTHDGLVRLNGVEFTEGFDRS